MIRRTVRLAGAAWRYEDHGDAIRACYADKGRMARIENFGPQPKLRYMERGFSYAHASVIENEVYRALVEGRSYNDAYTEAMRRLREAT